MSDPTDKGLSHRKMPFTSYTSEKWRVVTYAIGPTPSLDAIQQDKEIKGVRIKMRQTNYPYLFMWRVVYLVSLSVN